MRYAGPRGVLEVDLSSGVVHRYDLDDRDIEDAIGGVSLAVKLIADRVHGPLDPLGPDNPLVFAAGPFGSTPVPAGNEHALATVSPLTGLLHDGLSSSHWSAVLRRCGLAALVVTGVAPEWTALVIDHDRVRFEPAADLLGMSARDATKRLRERLADRTARVCAIGLGGENGVRFAAVENDGRRAGRGGTGAVMGAKRLKAIALRGRGAVAVADRERTARLTGALKARALGPAAAKLRGLGTATNLRLLERMGRLPTRNFSSTHVAGTERVMPERARESRGDYLELRAGCAGCPVQCEHMYVRKDRDRRKAAASDDESVWAFGPNCGIDDLDAVLDAIGRCDMYGMDPISAGSAIAFAMEAAERGLVARDTFGPVLAFGNAAVLEPAIDAIVHGTGFGAVLARGVRAASIELGGAAPTFAMHAKGLELPGDDPRAAPAYALSLATSTRGAGDARSATDPRADDVEPTDAVIAAEDDAIVWESLIICSFVRECFVDFSAEAAELWSAVTGLTLDADGLRAAAARTWKRKRAINARLGWTIDDDALPPRLAEPIADGPLAGARIEPAWFARTRERYETARAASLIAVP